MKFHIINEDPLPYKHQIIQMWEKYLPGTPPNRFEWMNRGNPAGAAQWFFAVKKNSSEIIGIASILPKEFYCKGKPVKGGIIGDIMVQPQYRGQGIGLTILTEISRKLSSGDLEFLYVVPNRASMKIVRDAGFLKYLPLKIYVKPIDLSYYINKYLKNSFVEYLTPFLKYTCKLILREATTRNCSVQMVDAIDDSFDRLWEKSKNNFTEPLSDHSSDYIQWRYLQNPYHEFRIVTYRNKVNSLLNYTIFKIAGNQVQIYDIFTLDIDTIGHMLNKITQIAREINCHAIYFTVSAKSKLLGRLRRYGFIYNRGSMQVRYLANNKFPFESLSFFEGDRNI